MRARMTRLTLAFVALLSLLGSTLALAPAARAATFTVMNLNDTGAGSLRQALADAALATGPDTIDFQPGLTGTITLASTLTIDQDVTITGPGANSLTISGNNTVQVLAITGGTVVINSAKIAKGSNIIGSGISVTNGGKLTLNNATVTENAVNLRAAGINVEDGTLTLNDSTISNNGGAGGNAGGIYAKSSAVTLNNSTVTGNQAANDGGGAGIWVQDSSTLILNASTVSNNKSGYAAGIESRNSAVTLTNSTISGNTSLGERSGLNVDGGTLNVSGSTFSGNKAGTGYGAVTVQNGTATLLNSTISGNTANGTPGGFTIIGNVSEVNLRFVTITGNVADNDNDGSGDGGGIWRHSGVLNIQSSIIAGNIDKGGQRNDCNGTYSSQGNNIFGNGTDCAAGATDTKVADINAVLNATLANNGGPTQTHALVAGSPAVGAGATTCPGGCPTTDQRGVARPQGARADIGAYEAEGELANPVVTRALTTSTSGNGTIAVQPAPNAAGGRYADGTQVTLRATAASGSQFVGWTVNNAPGGRTNPLTLTMNADQTVVANFSPLPPPPSFSDVPPGYWAYDQIIKFAQRGITTGCGGTEYCPERPVTRAEMAAFIIRTLTGTTAAPAGPATPTFRDVPTSHPQYGFIEALVKLGVTTGCGPGEYCPDRTVTRAEMAAFIVRALTGQTAAPAGPATATFSDVPVGHPQYGFIERMFALGVTTGCGDPNATPKTYCPNSNVTRAEMAVFIIRAYP